MARRRGGAPAAPAGVDLAHATEGQLDLAAMELGELDLAASLGVDQEFAEAVPRKRQTPSLREQQLGEVPDSPAEHFRYEPPKRRRIAAVKSGFASIKEADPRRITGSKRPLVIVTALTLTISWDLQAFTLLIPEIRADLGVSLGSLATVASAAGIIAILFSPVLGYVIDRVKRVRLLQGAAFALAISPLMAAVSTGVGLLALSRVVGAFGIRPFYVTQGPLIADWYPSRVRARVFAFIAQGNVLGGLVGIPVAGVLGTYFGWRVAIAAFGLVAVAAAVGTLFLREPVRGYHDRIESGTSATDALEEQAPLTFAESFRVARSVTTLRRIWYATPLAIAFEVSLAILLQNFLANQYAFDPLQRALISLIPGSVALVAVLYAGVVGDRLLAANPGRVMTAYGSVFLLTCVSLVAVATTNNIVLFVILSFPALILTTLIQPAETALISLVVPARIRGTGSGLQAPWQILGLILVPVVVSQTDAFGPRTGLLVVIPLGLAAAAVYFSLAVAVEGDIRAARLAATADQEARRARESGRTKMLLCRSVEVQYGGVQVLFGVDLDVEEGEILAVMGTNGAGKSTILRAIAGVSEASAGAIFLDGLDITHAPPYENAARGVVLVPGGRAIFPTLSVRDNLATAGWLYREDADYVKAKTEEILDFFPVLRERLDLIAGDLSGGEQQMVALGQAFLMKPRLLMIDELSLGLAPAIVEQLLGTLRRIHAEGTTIIIVEQSLNVAMTIAQRAVFMEKGEVRFDGTTAELLGRPELVRAVFMGGAGGRAPARSGPRLRDEVERPPVLSIEQVSVRFGGVQALSDVSLDVRLGEVVGCIGPNGAGKTSLFDVISGFVTPDEGRILVNGVDVTSHSPDRRAVAGVGRSFQNALLFPSITTRENIALAMERQLTVRSAGLSALWAPAVRRQERRVRLRVSQLIEQLGLDAYADKYVGDLSTGTRRAVDIACSMASSPELLLLDEPAAGLAQAEAEALAPVIQRLVRELGCGVVLIEHDLPLVTSVCDRLVAMELGRVLAVGKPADVIADPRVVSAYLAASDDVVARSGSVTNAVASMLLGSEEQSQQGPDRLSPAGTRRK